MPQMGESIFEGTITKWLKQPGEKVQRDEPLFEISTDKVDAEIPAPASGTLQEIKVQAGNTVQVNTVVGVISGDGEAAAAAPAAKQEAPAPAALATPQTPAAPPPSSEPPIPAGLAEDEKDGIERQEQGTVTETGEQGRIRSSPLVRKIAKENNINLAQVTGSGLGGRITKEDIEGFIAKHGKGGTAAPAQPAAQQPHTRSSGVRASGGSGSNGPCADRTHAAGGRRHSGRNRAHVGDAQEDRRAHDHVEAHQRACARRF